jgi:hypothetical protein
MVQAALQAYCGQDHQLDFGVLADYVAAMRAALEAAEAAAPPNARDATIAALRAEVDRLKYALTVPEVWSENERDGMAQAFKISDGKNGHYETLFAVAAWLLRHRSARAALGDAS